MISFATKMSMLELSKIVIASVYASERKVLCLRCMVKM